MKKRSSATLNLNEYRDTTNAINDPKPKVRITAGMVIKKESYVDYGMMKSTFKLTFGYEFLLRMTHNSVRFMTIPKIGYKHTNLREGSIFWNYKNGDDRLSEDEVRFWIDQAKKEYMYINQREIKYEPQEV